MLKKLLALMLSIFMIISVIAVVPVSAFVVDLPENIATDWVPNGKIEGNRYKSGSVYNTYQNAGVSFTYSKWRGTVTLSYDGALGDGKPAANKESQVYNAGIGVTSNEFWIGGESFIFSVRAKNNGGAPKLNFGVWQEGHAAVKPYKYSGPSDGVLVKNRDYEKFDFVVKVPENGWNAANNCTFHFGFPETPTGETEGSRSMIIDESSIYIGAEYP